MQVNNRRKYFRIDHEVSLELKIISEAEMQQHSTPVQFDVTPNFHLLTQLQVLEADSEQLLQKIGEQDANIGRFLRLINDKVDLVARTLATGGMEIQNLTSQVINLSEGGMMFTYDEALSEDQYLAVKLIFPETCVGILLYSKVCRTIPLDDGKFNIGIEFLSLPEAYRTLLARQIMLFQRKQRREELGNQGQEDDLS